MSMVRKADHIIALDISAEELTERLRSGRIVRPEDVERALAGGVFRPQTLRVLREMMLQTIDDLTTPELDAAKTSTALALITDASDTESFIRRFVALAAAFDLLPNIATPPDERIASVAVREGARLIALPSFHPNKPDMGAIKATLIALSNSSLARRLVDTEVDRDIFIADSETPHAPLQAPLSSGIYEQVSGDRMRIGYGRLTIYLGAAAGSGKTYAMLDRAHRLRKNGIDLVAALVETHNRADTDHMLIGIPTIERKEILAGGIAYGELDVEATLRRKPAVVLIDELAHTNAPGSFHAKRYNDVMTLLRAGISVITTLNIQHLEGLNDAVFRLTGTRVREIVPDDILRLAGEVVFIDATPETLRERLRRGKIYPAERIQAALSHFFRTENLASLRELTVREIIRARGLPPKPARLGRIALGVKGEEHDTTLIERCARIARRLETEVCIIHVVQKKPCAPELLQDIERAAARAHAHLRIVSGKDRVSAFMRAVAEEKAETIAVQGRNRSRKWLREASFARRLLDAGAKQMLVLAPPHK
jgi:two-component system sensor histidine kinase KdpD